MADSPQVSTPQTRWPWLVPLWLAVVAFVLFLFGNSLAPSNEPAPAPRADPGPGPKPPIDPTPAPPELGPPQPIETAFKPAWAVLVLGPSDFPEIKALRESTVVKDAMKRAGLAYQTFISDEQEMKTDSWSALLSKRPTPSIFFVAEKGHVAHSARVTTESNILDALKSALTN